MSYLTNSSGVQYSIAPIPHEIIVLTDYTPSYSASAFPSLKITNIPSRQPVNYGSSFLLPSEKSQIVRSSSVSDSPVNISYKRRRTTSQYDPLNDPHLKDYFERKFRMPSATKKNKSKTKKPGPNEIIYRVRVKTGNCNNASTDANVYLTICGSRGKWPRKHLFNKYNAIKTQHGLKFKFERNSVNVFKLIGTDVGQLANIIVEHDGKDIHSSWFLQEISITNTKTNRTWLFEYNDWLSLYHGLGKTKIELLPTRELEKFKKTTYQIITVTGDLSNASTDANAYVTLFGTHRSTQRLKLENKDKNIFQRGKSDVFKIGNISSIGQLRKIRVEHDNTGKSPGWFLDRVVVTDLSNPDMNYFGTCGKWLDKEQDDGLICRDIEVFSDVSDIRKEGKYKITVFTGDKRNAGTDADVSIELYGSLGNSGDIKLDNQENNFERGKKDEFIIGCLSVGEIKKLRIGHNNKGASSGWYLDKVIVDDLTLNRVYEFQCDRWLAKDEGDGKTTVILFPNKVSSGQEAGLPYILHIYTGDVRGAGTNSKIYVEMFGGRSGDDSSGRITLKGGEFERSNVDKIQVESERMLAPLSRLLIGHDNSGRQAGWFLDKVVVETPSIGMKQTFPCGKWLAKDEDDGRIERMLKENTSLREVRKPKSVWNMKVYTSNLKNSGTDANVFICLYGDQGKSDEIMLRANAENFERGKMDEFTIETEDVGQPFKMRVWHDNKGRGPGWHLDRIEMDNIETKERYIFICNRWLAEDEEDGEIVRELPAEGDSIRKPLPLVNYKVEVHTGSKSGAGTNADVFINLFGEFGDTGERWLRKSETNKDKFERNKVDIFTIEAVQLKRLEKIRIGHNGKRPGAGWFLNKVVVRQDGSSKYDQTFECNRWLAVDEDDGLIIRELFADRRQFLDTMTYNVKIKTGDIRNAGTDAHVHLKIFGDKGDTGDRELKKSENTWNKFERGRVDDFKIEAEDIGHLEKIRIGHDGKGLGSGWFLDTVEIVVPSKGKQYKFSAHRWLDENEGDRQTEIELFPTEENKIRKLIPYVITVKTADKRGSGTDANVFVQFYGPEGKSEEYFLRNNTNNFERGQTDVFKIEADDVGPLYKLRIGHDNKGASAGWFLESVHIQRHAIGRKKKQSHHSSRESLSDVEDYYFFVNRWFARDEDDKQIIRELLPTDADGRPLAGLEEVEYEVKVHTGDIRGAGTDANVFVNIYGENGDSGERELRKSDHINKFERNQIDTFIVKAIELGELTKIRIRHDNKGGGAAWYLEKVEIYNPATQKQYLFNCQDWLSKKEGDGKIERELPAIDPQQLKKVKFRQGAHSLKDQFLLETEAITNTYNVTVVTSDIRGAGTDATVYIQIFGEKEDSGKIPLENSKTHKNKFERGNSDVFEIKEADVGEIRKIKIGHDGKRPGAGWHLKEIIIDAPKLGKKWKFPCNRWLDKNEDDGQIERELFPMKMSSEEYTPYIPYEIVVYTSDKRGADTSANPYIVIYGEEIKTQKTELAKNKAERKDKFKRGAVDRFVLELDDVGKDITKIRIGHDNKGLSAGWHVEKVEIRRLKQNGKGSKIFVFPCNRWLARDEEDKAIERDLVPEKVIDERYTEGGDVKVREKTVRDRLELVDYTVEVFTGDVFGAGTNSNVFLTLFGEFGDSGEKKLIKSETHRDKFERNQMDRFKIQSADLGPLYKVMVRHDNSSFGNNWFLDRIEVNDNRDTYKFICERWLSKSKDDKQIERTLFEKNYRGPKTSSHSQYSLTSNIGGSAQMANSHSRLSIREHSNENYNDIGEGRIIPYKLTIRTGDEKHCGISAQAFIRLFGKSKNQRTDRIPLKLAKKKRFEPGSSEIFMIEANDIGILKQIELGHDGTGPNENWLVKSVELLDTINGKQYTINCNEWLGTEKGDGLTIKKFNVDESTTSVSSFRGTIPHKVLIFTGDVQNAGSDGNVTLKFFGSKTSSSDIFIEKLDNRFERAGCDELMIELEDIGTLKKVRVAHDSKGSRKEWCLDRIELTNLKTKKQYVFVANSWLSKKAPTIDVPLYKHGQETIGNTNYRITVKTSDISGAGTDANVFVTIFGANGDSGEIELKKSETNRNKFERNKTDVFSFSDILSLGELTKLRIRHDNTGAIGNTHWHLEYVRVEDLDKRGQWTFPCNKWLSLSKDDKQIVRELVPEGSETQEAHTPRPGERTEYEITVHTADESNSGTKQNVELVLIGEDKSKPIIIENTHENKVLRRGHKDKLIVKLRSVGELKRIQLAHVEGQLHPLSREDRNAAWICEKVVVKDLSTDASYVFPVLDALVVNKQAKVYKCQEKKESSVNMKKSLRNIKYEVVVVTGKEKGAGTGAKVFITMYGSYGDSGKRPLKGKFNHDHTDKCIVECVDLGKIEKVRIEHDNSSFNKDWFLDRIEILNTETGENIVFPCNKWLSKNKEDGEISRDLYPQADESELRNNRRRSGAPPPVDEFEKSYGRRERWRNEY